jgi:hypothetical protein
MGQDKVNYASAPVSLTTAWYFCSLFRSKSPSLTSCWYCAFLLSGRFVSTVPFTRSITQLSFLDGMNLLKSLISDTLLKGIRIDKLPRDAKLPRHVVDTQTAIALQQLRVRLASHLSDVHPRMTCQISIPLQNLFHFGQRLEVECVFSRIQRIDQLVQWLQRRMSGQNLQHLWRINNLVSPITWDTPWSSNPLLRAISIPPTQHTLQHLQNSSTP